MLECRVFDRWSYAARGGLLLLLVAASCVLTASASKACGATTDCHVGDRVYRVKLPANYKASQPAGVILFVHGWRGSMAVAMESDALKATADRLGVLLVAAKSKLDGWSLDGSPGGRIDSVDELAYFDALLADLSRRFAVDPRRRMVTGFSAGGMMVWTLACARSQDFAAFVPIAGTFWSPVPKSCAAPPANILHVHGDQDRVVPLSGRRVGDAKQGDVLEVIDNYAAFGGYVRRPDLPELPSLACKHRANEPGNTLSFCLFPGGHIWRARFIEAAWKHFTSTGAIRSADKG